MLQLPVHCYSGLSADWLVTRLRLLSEILHVPVLRRKTMTSYRGKKMAEQERLTQRLSILIIFHTNIPLKSRLDS